jgi:hypothetical protein
MKTRFLLCCLILVSKMARAEDMEQAQDLAHPQVIALTNGTKLTLLGLTYGKHHVAPNYRAIGGNIQSGNWINRTDDETVVWVEIEHEPGKWPSYSLLVWDQTNSACITAEVTTRCHVKEGVEVHGFLLHAFPRWQKEIALQAADPYGHGLSKEKFVVANPHPVSFGKQTPESLPVTKSDGDFEVTLTNLITGAPLPPYLRRDRPPSNDPHDVCVRIGLDFKQKGKSVTNWHPRSVETSDAMGNRVRGVIQYQNSDAERNFRTKTGHPFHYTEKDEYKGYFYQPGLWPDEPAWKVRLEFTRSSGFDDNEILTLTNLPVRAGTQKDHDDEWTWEPGGDTNLVFGDYTVNGIRLKLFVPILFASEINNGQKSISVIMRADPNPDQKGLRMTLLKATNDKGEELWTPFSPSAGYNCSIDFPNPKDAKSLNLQFALHKSRFVEFNVKPAKL